MILSAQATDKSVNKATASLFRLADTPAAMLAARASTGCPATSSPSGSTTARPRTSSPPARLLLERHAGEVPTSREELESLPGVGRKTANVILNTAFGEATIAVDTHIFRVANRTGIAPGKTVREVEEKLMKFVPPEFHQGCPSLADPARPLCLQGAHSRLSDLYHRGSVRVPAQDP